MKVKLTMELSSEKLAEAASRALDVDNKEAPKELRVACRREGVRLVVEVKHREPLTVLSTIEDLMTCLTPLVKLGELVQDLV